MTAKLYFDNGTLGLDGFPGEPSGALLRYLKSDPRSGNWRGRACDYAAIVVALQQQGIVFVDQARGFGPVDELALRQDIIPRPHQTQAFEAWRKGYYRGVAALPTGSGKTILAVMAIAALKRPAICLVPTIDLLQQWHAVLSRFLNVPVGMLGGGEREILPVTVSTYDSAVLNMEFIGNRFGLLIADECHHLPGPETRLAAAMCIAPFRLGLSATPELPEDRQKVLFDLIGPVVCQIHIDELEGKVLADYLVKRIFLKLDEDEAADYQFNRQRYVDFLHSNRINFALPSDWGRFLGLCGRSEHGRAVFASFLRQREIARGGRSKFRTIWELLQTHAGEQIIIFTADNPTAYRIGEEFKLPVITHQTKLRERKEFLDAFREGKYPVLVTSKVLNEGVDVPAANVGVIVSGSGSVREHVQRLGRILRPAPDKKQAVLYELISANTAEESVSERRRSHRAYTSRRKS